MNHNELFQSLSGIDPKYIDEAAYELHEEQIQSAAAGSGKVVDLSAKRRLRKYIAIAVPSAAAALLFIGIAMSGVLSSSKSQSAAPMAEAPAAMSEDAAAPAEEAAAFAEEAAAPAEEPMYDAAESEAPMVSDTAESEATSESAADAAESANAKTAGAAEATEAAEAEGFWEIKEASYDRGILILRCGGEIPENLEQLTYRLTKLNVPAAQSKVSGGQLSSLGDKISVTDNWIVFDLQDHELESGEYRITIGDLSAEFEVAPGAE